MSKIEKTLDKWSNRPTEVNKNEVESVLIKYEFTIDKKRGSHWIASHPSLVNKQDFGSLGELCIAIKGGQKVKGVYIKTILEAISIIEEEKGL